MPHIEALHAEHATALLDFETRNREYFAASVPDRGDDFFTDFAAQHAARLKEQETGTVRMHLIIDDNGQVAGRINLVDVADRAAELGYRIAQAAAGKGLATWAVREICELAANKYELERLRAKITIDNHASHAVLLHAGFTPTVDIQLNGRPGRRYQRWLTYSPQEIAST